MADPVVVKGDNNATYMPNEILVALEDLEPVMRALKGAGAGPKKIDSDDGLGLARLAVSNVQVAAAKLLEDSDSAEDRKLLVARGADDLDPLLRALRKYFTKRHGGWAPTIGKNRLLGHVVGGDGAVGHGGGGDPIRVKPEQWLPPRGDAPGQGVRVGVLDTAIANLPWLAGGWTGQLDDMLPVLDSYRPEQGHATFVAGLILSQAPGATVKMRRVLNENGQADCWTVAREIVALGRTGVDILNLSIVCYTEDGQPPMALATAVERLSPEVVVVAAAGNHGDLPDRGFLPDAVEQSDPRQAAFPGALPYVIAVGATGRDRRVTSFTPRDADWIDLVTIGTDVVSTYLDGRVRVAGGFSRFDGWAEWSGTSFAAALVSGALAAQTVPGRVSAKEALQMLRDKAPRALPAKDQWNAPPIVLLKGAYACKKGLLVWLRMAYAWLRRRRS